MGHEALFILERIRSAVKYEKDTRSSIATSPVEAPNSRDGPVWHSVADFVWLQFTETANRICSRLRRRVLTLERTTIKNLKRLPVYAFEFIH